MDGSTTSATEPKRPRPKLVTFTEAAARRIAELVEKSSKPCSGLRLSLEKGGCAGQKYVMDYAHQVQTSDEIIEDKGARLFIDTSALLFLIGTEIDYEITDLTAKFVFNNPNVKDACGCGESVTLEAAQIASPARLGFV